LRRFRPRRRWSRPRTYASSSLRSCSHSRSRARSRYLRAAAPRAPHSATRAHLTFLAAKELAPHSLQFYQSPVSHPQCPPGPAHPNAQSPGSPLRAPPNGRRKPGAHTHPWLRSGKLGDLANLDTQTLLEHLPGVRFPAEKDQVADTAERNDAPRELVQKFRDADTQRFNSPDEVLQAVQGRQSTSVVPSGAL
jgi:hypothetical protein